MLTRLLLLPLAFLLVLPATGCRDTLVDPNDDLGGPDPVTSELPAPYFKGPTELELGDSAGFRVEYVAGAAEYVWFIEDYSTGQLTGTFSTDAAGLERQYDAQAVQPGRVVLTVSVFDAEGDLIAGNTKTVIIE